MTEPIAIDDEYTRFADAVTQAYVRHAAARGLPHPTLDDRYRTAATAWHLLGRSAPSDEPIWPEPEAKPIRQPAPVDMAEYRQRRADSVEAAVTPTPAEDEAGESGIEVVPEPATPGVLALMGQFLRDGWKLRRP